MSTLTSNLYPPIVPDACPAFIRNGICRIYFSLSPYNSINEIKSIHISVVNQKTNASILNLERYPAGIKITTLGFDSQKKGDYVYYVDIEPNDLEGQTSFGLNQFYKVQLRFSTDSERAPTAEYLYNNRNCFSQWSKVCLIKGISQPKISLYGFDDEDSLDETILPSSLIEIVGSLSFTDRQEKEYLKSYNIKIYQEEDINTLLFDSGDLYPNPYNPNEFNYSLPYQLINGTYYVLYFTYTTNNLYTETIQYRFVTIQYEQSEPLDAVITATVNNEEGKIIVNLLGNTNEPFLGNFTIRRTSSKSDFHIWEDIKTVTYSEGARLDYTWQDKTVESGIWYKYCAQRRNSIGIRGPIIQTNNPVMCLLDDIFLTREDCQLKIQFNPTVGDFKYNVAQSQQTTIGAKYPYIRRNGNNYFRTFSIGGLISSFIDTTDWYDPHYSQEEQKFYDNKNEIKDFTSKNNIYKEHKQLYENYNNVNNINEYNDFIYEKHFRDKVYDFLYKNNVKLFRSATEGNILIKLTNINFQPIESLGRRLYSFTATAVEIDEANIINYEKYNIIDIGAYEQYIIFEHQIQGFLQITTPANSYVNILNEINSKYQKQATTGFKNEVNYLSQLKLEIDSQPYIIIETPDGPKKADSNDTIEPGKAISGYIVSINNKKIIVYPKIDRRVKKVVTGNTVEYIEQIHHIGVFELKESNTMITELGFNQKTNITINYTALLKESEDTSHLIRHYYYYYKPGQLYGTFEPTESLMKKIRNKYLLKYSTYYQKLVDVTEIKLEGAPGTVVYVKDSASDDFNRYVLANGFLQLKDDQILIQDLYFCGIHLLECKDPLQISRVNGVPLTVQQGVYDSIADIEAAAAQTQQGGPVNGGIYQVRYYGITQQPFPEWDATERYILKISQNSVEKEVVNPETLYTLLLNQITDDNTIKFVYYYGCWYLLSKGVEVAENLLKADIRHVRNDEFILTGQTYQDFKDIKNPIKNGVYHISPLVVEDDTAQILEDSTTLQVSPNGVQPYALRPEDYALKLQRLFIDISQHNFIYYNGKWCPFTNSNDVICSVDGIVDYYAEIMKGVY